MSLRQASLGKENERRTRKPFVGTLRVINPVRKSRASSRKRVLRGEGRPSLRSVDSEVKGRVIEPRKLTTWGAFVVDISGGRVGRVALGPTERGRSYRGRRARTMARRVLQEPERPDRLHRHISGSGDRNPQLPEARGWASKPSGAKHGAHGGIAKRRQRSAARGAVGSRSVS
jgi:hypothetical protein